VVTAEAAYDLNEIAVAEDPGLGAAGLVEVDHGVSFRNCWATIAPSTFL
jgi:hypothetical protein